MRISNKRILWILNNVWFPGVNYGIKLERIRQARRKYFRRKRKPFSKNTKQLILLAQSFRCRMCGNILSVPDFDHIDGNKANNSLSNCQALCPTCHTKKTRKKNVKRQ